MSVVHEIILPMGDAPPELAGGSVFFVGTATVLIRYAGFTILTDPNFIHMHEQVPIGYAMHATRLTDPAIEIQDLPHVDLVLLSHFHGDHFDQVAERELRKSVPIVTTPEAAGELRDRGFAALYPLDRWSTASVVKGNSRLQITSTPGRHGPPLSNLVMPEVMGSILEFHSTGKRPLFSIYITGDTLVTDDLKEIPRRYPDIDLALLHLGGTKVLGVMVTMDGKQGVETMQIVRPRLAIPIHFDDYDLFKSPLSDYQTEVEVAGLQDRVRYLSRGDTYSFRLEKGRIAA